MHKTIYLDYNATTPVDPLVLESMMPFFQDQFGNPSSKNHSFGWDAQGAVDKARKQVAHLVGTAQPEEIIFTSGATESNNMVLFGVLYNQKKTSSLPSEKPHIITSQLEHSAILEVCKMIEGLNLAEVTYLKGDAYGQVHAKEVEEALQPNTLLISLIMANNEIGTVNPMEEIGNLARKNKVLFHTDAAQAVGKIPIDLKKLPVDLLSMSGHKIYGPKGVGALYIRKNTNGSPLAPIMGGGHQEMGLRPGTLNVPAISGLGAACEIAEKTMAVESKRISQFREHLIQEVLSQVPEAQLNGHPTERLYNNVSFSFKGLSADLFALGLSGMAVSSGSACSTGQALPSHVLMALGHSKELAKSTLRIGLGRFTTWGDVHIAVDKIVKMVKKHRSRISAL